MSRTSRSTSAVCSPRGGDALAEGVAAKEIVLQKPFSRDDALAAIDRAKAAANVRAAE